MACSFRPGEIQERVARWREVLVGGERQRINQGMAVSVPAGRAGELAALCVAEPECCSLFDFVLHIDGPMAHLRVRALKDAHAPIEQLVA